MFLSREQKVQIAGLFHDIGKLGERAEIELSQSTQNAETEYCPQHKSQYTHRHVLWTVEFFEKVFNGTLPTEIKDIMRWASLHHQYNLTEDEAKAVQQADRISSGHDRNEVKKDYNQKWSKLSVTCFSNNNQNNANGNQSIFIKPHCCDKYDSLQNLSSEFLNWREYKDKQEINKMHKDLWDDLVKDFKNVWDNYQKNKNLLILLLCEMQRKYLTWVPVATNTNNPKVSLYDHQRTTAGFAHCVLADQNKCHYLLIEISGIQKFIYNVYETKKATKILRGRSTFIELISEIITHKLSKLSINYANIFLNTKGKISYLLPTSIKAHQVHEILNNFKKELNERYGFMIGLDYILEENIEYTQFQKENFKKFKENINKKMQQSKLQPLKLHDDKTWNQINQDIKEINSELCRYCKEQVASETEDQIPICQSCKDLIKIGKNDVKNNIRIFSTRNSDNSIEVFQGLHILYYESNVIPKDSSVLSIQVLKEHSDFEFLPQNQGYFSTPIKQDDDVLSFDDMNEKSVYLAIVKADVDNLGDFIIQNTKSTGELASLSHQIQWFFRGRSQEIIKGKEYRDKIYPVYLAGDDFFLVGNHDILPVFLQQIRSEFKELTYKKLGWSCAYQLFKSGSPLLSLAEDVEDKLGRIKSTEGKDQFFFHSQMMRWDELQEMLKMWDKFKDMKGDIGDDHIGLFRRLLQFSNSARQKNPASHDLLWPAYYNYYLQRKFPPQNGVQSETFNKIENIFKVLEDQKSSPMGEFYTQQAIEFYLLEQRQKEKKENEL